MTTKISAGTTTTVRTDDCIRAYGPVVHIVAGDIQSNISPTGSSSIASIDTHGTSTATATGPAITGSGSDTKTTKVLSTGASAGIGVGSGLAVILVVGVVIFFFRVRWRRLGGHETAGQALQIHANSKTDQGFPYHQERQQQQQQQTRPSELSIERVYEL
ncbi:hypothetical protein F4801DRAFT_300703 [Xylaria longipes]|nr:hypothetical protein F4801DRAFT_300703 [Xylaria longipes]